MAVIFKDQLIKKPGRAATGLLFNHRKMFMYRYNPVAYEYHYNHYLWAQYSSAPSHTKGN